MNLACLTVSKCKSENLTPRIEKHPNVECWKVKGKIK